MDLSINAQKNLVNKKEKTLVLVVGLYYNGKERTKCSKKMIEIIYQHVEIRLTIKSQALK